MTDSDEITRKGSVMVALVYTTTLLALVSVGLWAGRVNYEHAIKNLR